MSLHKTQTTTKNIKLRIIIGSDRRPATKQGIEGRFRSGRVRDSVRDRIRVRDRVRVRDKDHRSEPDRRSEAINFGIQITDLNLTPCLN